jgi:hypothetical protein
MGIDIYVDEIFDPNQKKHQAAFDKAVAEHEKASDKRDHLWEKVLEAYDAMLAVGYLRENYHGGPYVTRYLVREAFEAEEHEAAIPAAVLRERLPAAVMLAIYRDHVVYGEEPGIIMLDPDALANILSEVDQLPSGANEDALVNRITQSQRVQAARLISLRDLSPEAMSFVEFVEQCEAQEAKTGKPCMVRASY